MQDLPLHAGIVHIPIGLAFVMPLVMMAVCIGVWRNWFDKKVWGIVLFLQVILFVSCLAGLRTGEAEEERVEKIVAEAHIHEHEERAEIFTVLAGVSIIPSLVGMFLKKPKGFLTGMVMGTVFSFAVLGAGLLTGKKGGELVYFYGAAKAYSGSTPPSYFEGE